MLYKFMHEMLSKQSDLRCFVLVEEIKKEKEHTPKK